MSVQVSSARCHDYGKWSARVIWVDVYTWHVANSMHLMKLMRLVDTRVHSTQLRNSDASHRTDVSQHATANHIKPITCQYAPCFEQGLGTHIQCVFEYLTKVPKLAQCLAVGPTIMTISCRFPSYLIHTLACFAQGPSLQPAIRFAAIGAGQPHSTLLHVRRGKENKERNSSTHRFN